MNSWLPTQRTDLLRAILGRRLSRVIRWLYEEDIDRLDFEQDADGPTSLIFDPQFVLHVQADQERQGVKLSTVESIEYGSGYRLTDVSENRFWKPRVGNRVARIAVLKSKHATSDYPMEFGLELGFEIGLNFCLEYVDSEEWPDTLRVRHSVEGVDVERVLIE